MILVEVLKCQSINPNVELENFDMYGGTKYVDAQVFESDKFQFPLSALTNSNTPARGNVSVEN